MTLTTLAASFFRSAPVLTIETLMLQGHLLQPIAVPGNLPTLLFLFVA